MDDVEPKVKSLAKALGILDYFTTESPERGISELAELTGLFKSSVHNMVSTFESCGFMEKNEATGKYRLGTKILQLSNNLYQSHDLRNLIRPYMERISSAFSENVYLASLFEGEVIYIDTVYPAGAYAARSILGLKAPLYCTGVGKAIMAWLPPAMVEEIAARGFEAFTPRTVRDRDSLLRELEATRERGYAIDDMEHEFGIKCVAVPIRNMRNAVVASMSVSGPSLRFGDERVVEIARVLLEAQRELKGLIRR
jgi:DNA-binding IclR family transcriptional regulator